MKILKNCIKLIQSKFFKDKTTEKHSNLLLMNKEYDEDFYSTIKLKTGEEIFSKVMPSKEQNEIILLLNNPITISEVTGREGFSGYKLEPWLKTTKEDLFVLNINDVLTLSENNDLRTIRLYETFIRRNNSLDCRSKPNVSRDMGYLCNVKDAKDLLEKLYNN